MTLLNSLCHVNHGFNALSKINKFVITFCIIFAVLLGFAGWIDASLVQNGSHPFTNTLANLGLFIPVFILAYCIARWGVELFDDEDDGTAQFGFLCAAAGVIIGICGCCMYEEGMRNLAIVRSILGN